MALWFLGHYVSDWMMACEQTSVARTVMRPNKRMQRTDLPPEKRTRR